MKNIQYKKGYKYQLISHHHTIVNIHPKEDIETKFITLKTDGTFIIRSGYAWDGPSGPTIDTSNFMRGSMVHDALYQLIRQGHLFQKDRKQADIELRERCLEDGMCKFRANYVYKAVRKHGVSSASPNNIKKIYIAPKYSRKIDNELT